MRHGARNILLVDDETVNRMALARLLSRLGVTRVMEAENGRDALAHCGATRFDAIICDIDMHPMDGIQFLSALRAATDAASRDTPVIMLSKYSAGRVVRSAREGGANAYLVKPVSGEMMLETLGRVAPPAPNPPAPIPPLPTMDEMPDGGTPFAEGAP